MRLARIALVACWAGVLLLVGKIGMDAWMQQVTPMKDLPAWITALPIAHRGLYDRSAGVPENSLAAFGRAIDAGYACEFDVRLLADGRLAVFHDSDLRRMTRHCGRLRDATRVLPGKHA
jgi:glycerophosphoryl diester phosphodiesterase